MPTVSHSRSARGFTLIELLIVIVIVAILAAVAVPLYLQQRDKAKDAAVKKGARVVQVAIQSWAMDHNGAYPDSSLVRPDGEVGAYIDTWPENPWTGKPMAGSAAYSRGDFGYEAWTGSYAAVTKALPSGYEQYGLVGWTSNEADPFIVQPFSDTLLYSTDFKDMNGLTVLTGAWVLTAEGIMSSTSVYENRLGVGDLAVGDKAWTDVQLDVAATLTKGDGYGVYYRADGQPNVTGYCFQFDPGLGNQFVVRKVVKGAEGAPIAKVAMPKGFSVYGSEHQISISVVGDRHVITVDGQQVMEFKDASFVKGMAGLRTWDYSKVNFRSLKVSKAK
jgi:fructan beta-fructosidase